MTELFKEVDGKNDSHEVSVFSLSTCMWCKKCKQFLKEKDMKYKYIDIDQIPSEQKAETLQYLREAYQVLILWKDGMRI